MYDLLVYAAPTVVTHNAQFINRASGQVVALRGINTPANTTPKLVDELGNVTFVRIRVNWSEIEPSAGQFDTAAGGPLDDLDQRVEDYAAEGINVLIDFHVTATNPMPVWASQATGPDWWADPTSPGLYEPFADMMVNRYDAYANVMGYELWNEPQGAPATAAGTDEVIRWESKVIASIRQIDTQRAIVVMLRGGSDLGLRHAQLHHFTDTRHLVLDFHDPFCGCVTNAKGRYVDGYSPDGESLIKPSGQMANSNFSDYTGTKADQALHLAYVDRWVKVLNRPVIVGEFEVPWNQTNGVQYQDDLTDLMRSKGYSWARWQGPGQWALAGVNGGGYGPLNPEGLDLANILAGPGLP